jgi:aldehyde dehydrogenase (NAD(P)+)
MTVSDHVATAAPDFDKPQLDDYIATLNRKKTEWARLPIRQKHDLLRDCLKRLNKQAQAFVDASVRGKRLLPQSPWVGEEWVSGPWAIATALRELMGTLDTLDNGQTPRFKGVRTRLNGQTVVEVFPNNPIMGMLLNGVEAEVWMQPGVQPHNLPQQVGTFYQQTNPEGAVALVLGAGNINSIPAMDALHKLINEGEVVLIKLNPVNDYLEPLMNAIFQPLIERGYLYVTSGGAEVGKYLTTHDGIDTVHITGSARTHDLIVFGPGEEGARRKAENDPLLKKPMTSELGGVGPVIVVPGEWEDEDYRFQAERIVTMKFHNSGFNCVAAQVLILPETWAGSARLLDEIRQVIRELPPRVAYYPGADARQNAVMEAHPDAETFHNDVPRTLVTDLDPDDDAETCFRDEFFAPVLAQTQLPGDDPASFLQNAVAFANDTLDGTLGANVIIHPQTLKAIASEFDQALEDLNYGSIAVNGWNALAYLICQCPWGAARGHTLNDVQSGIGTVHNTYLLDNTQKSIVYAPFYPAPRSVAKGELTLLPKPSWFVTHGKSDKIGRAFAYYTITQNPIHLATIFANALRG